MRFTSFRRVKLPPEDPDRFLGILDVPVAKNEAKDILILVGYVFDRHSRKKRHVPIDGRDVSNSSHV